MKSTFTLINNDLNRALQVENPSEMELETIFDFITGTTQEMLLAVEEKEETAKPAVKEKATFDIQKAVERFKKESGLKGPFMQPSLKFSELTPEILIKILNERLGNLS